jgi:LmbE family N-acetylglucosaminyl deacetylase
MSKTIDLGSILGVWAHPDDEAFLSAGLMASARQAGRRVMVVSATLGEQGTPDPVEWPPARLAALRATELERSLAALGVVEHRTLGHPDGGVADVPLTVGARQVAEAIDHMSPDTILTFGPDGYTGHPDHRAIAEWVAGAVELTNSTARVLHATVEPGHLTRFEDVHDRFNVFFAGRPSETEAADMAAHATFGGAILDRKIAALVAQSSQTGGLIEAMGLVRFGDWVATESFVAAEKVGLVSAGR